MTSPDLPASTQPAADDRKSLLSAAEWWEREFDRKDRECEWLWRYVALSALLYGVMFLLGSILGGPGA